MSRPRTDPRFSEGEGVGSFRAPLDLSHIVTQYERRALPGGTIGEKEEDVNYIMPPDEDHSGAPAAIRLGPLRASTSRVMAPLRPLFAWDPNRYYRHLGIPWPYVNATRKDLRIAYVAHDGPNDRLLTHCFKQLLNWREEYDRLPLGVLYLNDDLVQEALKRAAFDEAHKRTEAGQYTTVEEVLDEQGYVLNPDLEDLEETPEEDLDEDHLKRQDDATVGAPWLYGFYVWGTHEWNTDLLREWQEGLLSEINGRVPYLSVGLMGRKQKRDYAVTEVDGEIVVFIRRDIEVTETTVGSAVQALLKQTRHQGSAPAQLTM